MAKPQLHSVPLLLNAQQVAQMLGGVDVERVKELMKSDIIKCDSRSNLLQQNSTERLTTPLAVVDYIGQSFGYNLEEARKYYAIDKLFSIGGEK